MTALRVSLLGLGAGVFAAGVFAAGAAFGYQTLSSSSPVDIERKFRFDARRSMQAFSLLAEKYDKKVDREELFMGIKLLRWYVMRTFVSGNVLEISAGTGRNLSYYDSSSVVELTLTDTNRDMLLEASSKIRDGQDSGLDKVSLYLADAQCLVGESLKTDCHKPDRGSLRNLRERIKFPSESFDTVIDTFGLCSLADPEKALMQMVAVVKPGGKLVLLEHGRGTWRLINDVLDAQQASHFNQWGCNFNRDIDSMVERLIKTQDVEEVWRQRFHFGTTLCCVLEKKPGLPTVSKEST
jgi:methyltransferase OMS1